eukprot:GHUV01012903.1.p1 GENE.GHUV01012903.1~~GHUV01012903.1.p1  ORF type:complete len:751 (+),score=385.79 GHUV01012903.1:1683-3935(+)
MHHAAVIAAASNAGVAADASEDPQQTLALAAILDEHQDQQPKSSKLLPALQEALRQQAALMAAAAAADAEEPAGSTGTRLPGIEANRLTEGSRRNASAATIADTATERGTVPTAGAAAQPGAAVSNVTAPRHAAGHADSSLSGPEAADLLLLLGAAAAGVKLELGVSYLCKSAAGQISCEEGRLLLRSLTADHTDAAKQQLEHQQQQEHQQQLPGEEQKPKIKQSPGPSVVAAATAPAPGLSSKPSAEGLAPECAAEVAADTKEQCTSSKAAKRKHSSMQPQQQQGQRPAQRPRQSIRLQSKLKRSRDGSPAAEDTMQQDQQTQPKQQRDKVTALPGSSLQPAADSDAAAGEAAPPPKQRRKHAAHPSKQHEGQQQQQATEAFSHTPTASAAVVSATADEPASTAVAAADAPTARDQACQTPGDLMPGALRSPGLMHLATAVHKLLDEWLLLLTYEQLSAWDKRQQMVKQALLRENFELQQPEGLGRREQQQDTERLQQQQQQGPGEQQQVEEQLQQQQQAPSEQQELKEEEGGHQQRDVQETAVHKVILDLAPGTAQQGTVRFKVPTAAGPSSDGSHTGLQERSPVEVANSNTEQQQLEQPPDTGDSLSGKVCQGGAEESELAASPAAASSGDDEQSQHLPPVVADAPPEAAASKPDIAHGSAGHKPAHADIGVPVAVVVDSGVDGTPCTAAATADRVVAASGTQHSLQQHRQDAAHQLTGQSAQQDVSGAGRAGSTSAAAVLCSSLTR